MNKHFLLLIALFISNYSISVAQGIVSLDKNKDIIYDIGLLDSLGIVALGKHNLTCWNIYTKNITHNQKTDGNQTCMDISTDGKSIATGNRDGLIRIIRTCSDSSVINRLFQGQGSVTNIAINNSGSKVAASFLSGFIVVYSLKSGDIWMFRGHKKEALAVDFSEDEKYLLSGGANGFIKIWDIDKQTELISKKRHRSWIREVLWCENDSKIISIGDDGNILIWKEVKGDFSNTRIEKIIGTGIITGIDYDAKMGSIAICTIKGNIKVYYKFGTYEYKLPYALHDIIIIPGADNYFYIALATNGKGVIIIDSREMRSTNK